MIKKLVKAPCAKCKKEVEFYVVEGFNNELTLSNYSHFKTPIINICPECGYINDNLNEDNILYQNISLSLIDEDDLISNLIDNIKIARKYLNSVIDVDKKIRIYANIFENNKMLLNSFLQDNYTKTDEQTNEILSKLQNNLKNSANEVLSFINESKINDNFTNLLQIEVLSSLNKTDEANKIYKTLPKLSADLLDYIEECIEIGGLC